MHRKMRNAPKTLVGKCGEKRPLRRPRHRQKDSVKMDRREVGGKVWTGFI
jgi:hypothetical protein